MSAPLSAADASREARIMSFQPDADYQQTSIYLHDESIRRQAAARASTGSADVDVHLEDLVTLYNRFSELHTQLSSDYQTMAGKLSDLRDVKLAGGLMPELEAAWETMKRSAGDPQNLAEDSLLGNVRTLDQFCVYYMKQILDTVNSYADMEQRALHEIGKAAQLVDERSVKVADVTPHATPAGPAHSNTSRVYTSPA